MTTSSQGEFENEEKLPLSQVVGDEGGGGISAGGIPGATSGAGLREDEATKGATMRAELYHKRDCPHSAKVRGFIERNGLVNRVEYHDVESEPGARERLRKVSGKEQVPCLVVDESPILESDAITAWLETNFVRRDSTAA